MTTVARYNGTIVGLTNTTWQAGSVVRDRAATEGQLADAAGSGGGGYTKAEIDQKLVDVATGLQSQIDVLGEPFRVRQWSGSSLNVQIPYCTEDVGNTSIPKMEFTIDDVEGADYQIVGMIAYEVRDGSGQRINCWPVCQFTGNGQKTLTVRWMCGGTSRKTASSLNAWVLLKHR